MRKLNISRHYKNRFSTKDISRKSKMWRTLCKVFLQQFVGKNDTVVDLGAGYCEFINNIKCGRKIAVDVNPDTKKFANKDVLVINKSVFQLSSKFNNCVDIVFLSNFLEHLDSKDDAVNILYRVNQLLKKGGKVILLQPNIDLVKEAYWDFIDHKIALNTRSIKEALEISGFKINTFVKRFLPYTTKNSYIPLSWILLKIYLLLPQLLRPFAGQTFVVAAKR